MGVGSDCARTAPPASNKNTHMNNVFSEASRNPRLRSFALPKVAENLHEVADRGKREKRLREKREDSHFIGAGEEHKGQSHDEGDHGAPAFPAKQSHLNDSVNRA